MKKWLIALVLLIALLSAGQALASTPFSYILFSDDGAFMVDFEIDDMGNIAVFDISEYEVDTGIALVAESGFDKLIGQNISTAQIDILPEAPDACKMINEILTDSYAQVPWASTVSSSSNVCNVCHSSDGIYTCNEVNCPEGILCPKCMIITLGWQPKCSSCRGRGTQYVMGTQMPCSRCLGKGETILEFIGGQCENCHRKTVCAYCFGVSSMNCPYCNTDGYQEFVYNKVLRDPSSGIGNHYLVKGTVVETIERFHLTEVHVKIRITDDVDIVCTVMYGPIEDFNLLIGDNVCLYTKLVDIENNRPLFFASKAELVE